MRYLVALSLLVLACGSDPVPAGGCPVQSPAHANYLAQSCYLSCERGWMDCDNNTANGCEANVAEPTSCGACNTICTGALSCQLSPGSTIDYRCWTR